MGLREIAIGFREYLEGEIDNLTQERIDRGEVVYVHKRASGDLGAVQLVYMNFRDGLFSITGTTPNGALAWSSEPVADLNEKAIDRQFGFLDRQIAATEPTERFERLGANDMPYYNKLIELKGKMCELFGYLNV